MMQPKTAERRMRSTAEVMKSTRAPTAKEAEAIRDVHELAFRFDLGQATLAEVRAATKGKQRWLATRFTPPDDPAFRPLMAMLDALIDDSPAFATKQGSFETDDLFAHEGKLVREDGRDLLCWPIKYPWLVKPDEDGNGGERGEPIYRKAEERKPHYGSFGNAAPAEREPDWWED